MRLFFPTSCSKINWSIRPRFRDKELAAVGFGDASNIMVADKLIEVRLLNGQAQWILIHIEVQAQYDAALAQRMFDYNYHISNQYGKPVSSLVLLADENPAWNPHHFHYEALETVTDFSFATAKLQNYANRTEELMASDNPFAWVALAHLRTQQARHDPDKLYAAKWQLTKLLFQHRWTKRRIIVLFKVINWMIALPTPHQERYWQAVLRFEKERKMELLNPLEQWFVDQGWEKGLKKGMAQGLEKGLEKGLEQGLEQGRNEGAAALLEWQLERRFGPLSQPTQRKLAKASMEQLRAWSEALIDAQSLKQVFK